MRLVPVVTLVYVLALFGPTIALAQTSADIGVVTLVSGSVTLTSEGAEAFRTTQFMRVRDNDRISVPSGASLRIVYFQSGRADS